jgi:glycosyltransferase involved in cell wall biosynthesis
VRRFHRSPVVIPSRLFARLRPFLCLFVKKKRPFLDHFFSLKRNMPITTTKNNINKRKRNDFEKNEDDSDDKGQFDVSVLLPVHNALPHLTSCLLCLFAQEKVRLEIIVVDDSSTDGSFERIGACKRAYETLKEGEGGEWKLTEDEKEEKEDVGNDFYANKVDCNLREEFAQLEEERGNDDTYERIVRKYCKGKRHKIILRKLERSKEVRSGQGLALNLAYSLSTCEYVAEMEADDMRPQRCFYELLNALKSREDLDATFSQISLIGDLPSSNAPQEGWIGMERFRRWQNSLTCGTTEMAPGRYIEIPAMRASGCYRRSFLEKKMNLNKEEEGGIRIYDDLWRIGDEVVDFAVSEEQRTCSSLKRNPNHWWPVDVSFLHRAFNSGMRCHKVERPMYWWRQYAKQSTKVHDRCSLERLRAAKVHYMLKEDGPLGFAALFTADGDTDAEVRDVDALANSSEPDSSAAKIKNSPRGGKEQKKLIIRVFGRGETLNAYVADINREIELIRAKEKEEHYARHKKPLDATATITTTDEDDDTYQPKLLYVVEKRDEMPGLPKRKRSKENGLDKNTKLCRLFAFGMQKAREKILRVMRDDFDTGGLDWFVA